MEEHLDENHDKTQDTLVKVTGMYKDWFLAVSYTHLRAHET